MVVERTEQTTLATGTQYAPYRIPGGVARVPHLWAIARRRWPVLVLLPLLALSLAAYNYKHTARTYTASGEATITSIAPDPPAPQGYDNYYRALTSEASADDLVRVVQGSRFADDVAKRLQTTDTPVSAAEVQGAITSTRVYRVLTINATSSDQGRALVIARAALDTLVANAPAYLSGRPVQAAAINVPSGVAASSLRSGVLAAGTLIASLLAALAIALLVELFDTRLHDGREVEEMLGLPLIGTVPPTKRAS